MFSNMRLCPIICVTGIHHYSHETGMPQGMTSWQKVVITTAAVPATCHTVGVVAVGWAVNGGPWPRDTLIHTPTPEKVDTEVDSMSGAMTGKPENTDALCLQSTTSKQCYVL